ncbi:hypothetical protein [Methylobacterium sp. A54F]
MNHPAIHQVIRALAEDGRVGAIGLAEHAVEAYAKGFGTAADQSVALDILLRDLARLQGVAPHLSGFIRRVETVIDRLHPSVAPRAA